MSYVQDDDKHWDGEICERTACKGAKVVWFWDHSRPGAWGQKECLSCGHLYAGISCPYVPEGV